MKAQVALGPATEQRFIMNWLYGSISSAEDEQRDSVEVVREDEWNWPESGTKEIMSPGHT